MIPHKEWAKALHQSARTQQPRDQFSTQNTYTLKDAYTIQHALIQERVNEGHTIIGVKMGFTSLAKMKQMGVDDMIIGQLTQDMRITRWEELDALTRTISRITELQQRVAIIENEIKYINKDHNTVMKPMVK